MRDYKEKSAHSCRILTELWDVKEGHRVAYFYPDFNERDRNRKEVVQVSSSCLYSGEKIPQINLTRMHNHICNTRVDT